MKLNLEVAEMPSLFSRLLRGEVREEEGDLSVAFDDGEECRGPSLEGLQELLDTLDAYSLDGETTLYSADDIEFLVQEEVALVAMSFSRRGHLPLALSDPDQELEYRLGPPSEHYLLFLIDQLNSLESTDRFFWPRRVHGRFRQAHPRQRAIFEDAEEEEETESHTVLDALRQAMPRTLTLRVRSSSGKSLRNLQQHADAFLFQLAYNLDTAFVAVRSLQETVRRTRLRRLRRARPEDLDPPRRVYVPDLVYHYQMAVATESVALEFLSYYHVAEHFFEAVFEDDLIHSLRETLTQPGFSYRRKDDVKSIIRLVTKRLRLQKEDVTFSEVEALRLVLSRFVRLDDLRSQLDLLQESLLAYYASNAVSFSGGDRVDLRSEDTDSSFSSLSYRIYKTRNAMVHSKDGGKPRYVPFQHDPELAQELPLLRLVAEQIVVNSSTFPSR